MNIYTINRAQNKRFAQGHQKFQDGFVGRSYKPCGQGLCSCPTSPLMNTNIFKVHCYIDLNSYTIFNVWKINLNEIFYSYQIIFLCYLIYELCTSKYTWMRWVKKNTGEIKNKKMVLRSLSPARRWIDFLINHPWSNGWSVSHNHTSPSEISHYILIWSNLLSFDLYIARNNLGLPVLFLIDDDDDKCWWCYIGVVL